jgi:predicted flap endonuclease-1-like 5' DNA nuclease
MESQVKKINGIKSGRGFSLSEVQKAGFTLRQVRKLGIYVDTRRRTLHEFNVETLQVLINERQKQLEEEIKRAEQEREEAKIEKEKKEKRKKKEEKERKEKEKRERKKKEEKEKKLKEEKIKKEEIEEKIEEEISLTEIKGVGKKRAEALEAAGIHTVADLLAANADELAEKTQFTPDYIEKLKENARML